MAPTSFLYSALLCNGILQPLAHLEGGGDRSGYLHALTGMGIHAGTRRTAALPNSSNTPKQTPHASLWRLHFYVLMSVIP